MLSRGLDLLDIVIGSGQLAMWSFCVALDLAAIMVVSNGVIAARSYYYSGVSECLCVDLPRL